jgi:hypothetical protein
LRDRLGLGIPPTPLSRRRKLAALTIAGLVDVLQVALFPLFIEGAGSPLNLIVDLITAAILTGVLGFRWRMAMGLAAELIPGLDLFPTWTALVLSLPGEGPDTKDLLALKDGEQSPEERSGDSSSER